MFDLYVKLDSVSMSSIRNALSKLLPVSVKRTIKARIRTIANSDPTHIPRTYCQSHAGENAYCVKPNFFGGEGLPVPPEELWAFYGPDAQTYISLGKKQVAEMARIVEESGVTLTKVSRVLELGCAAGRMLRHVPVFAPNAEYWGVDISAKHIQWCVDNLTPAMPTLQFATTTVIPHLPFEDR